MSCVSSLLGMAAHHGVRVNFFISSLLGLPNNETTYAELVKEKDYATGYIGNVTLFNSLIFGCYGSNFKGVISEHMSRNKFIRSSVKFLPGERHRTLLMTVQHWFVYWLGAAMVNTTLQWIHGCNSGVEFQLWGICDRETGSHLNMKITCTCILFFCVCFFRQMALGTALEQYKRLSSSPNETRVWLLLRDAPLQHEGFRWWRSVTSYQFCEQKMKLGGVGNCFPEHKRTV